MMSDRDMTPLIGPFFFYGGRLLARPIPWSAGERRADKYDDSLGHAELYDQLFPNGGEYMDFPRGRVIWDAAKEESILYMDRCISARPNEVEEVRRAFQVDRSRVEHDEHYICPQCMTADGPERIAIGSLILLVGGTRVERERDMGEFKSSFRFTGSLVKATRAGDLRGFLDRQCKAPYLALSEIQEFSGKPTTETLISELLIDRYYHGLPTVLGMDAVPLFLKKLFPIHKKGSIGGM